MPSKNYSMRFLSVVVLLLCVIGITVSAQSNGPLTNADIINMVKEKVDESIIMRSIATSEINFDISPAGLIQLKKGKVKSHLIEAIQNAQLRKTGARTSSGNTNSTARPKVVNETLEPLTSPTPTPNPSPTPKPIPVATQDSEFYRFDLNKCAQSGSSVLCNFTITNLGEYRHLWVLTGDSNIIDGQGNQVFGQNAKMANSYKPEANIPEGISIEYSITFERMPVTATKIARLTIAFYPRAGSSRTELVFKNVPLRN
jgi:hypothetical protein